MKESPNKAIAVERRASILSHRQATTPLLVSPLLLRSLGMGQIDASYFDAHGGLVVVEAKSAGLISARQRRRLLRSCRFLSALFGKASQLVYFFARSTDSLDESKPVWYNIKYHAIRHTKPPLP